MSNSQSSEMPIPTKETPRVVPPSVVDRRQYSVAALGRWLKRMGPRAAAGLWQWIKLAYENFSQINGSLWSASFSYYAFFALFPLLVFLVTLATNFTDQQRAFGYIVGNVEHYMPLGSQDREMIRKTVDGVINASGKIGFLSLLGLLWSALGFFQALVGAVNAAWNQKQPNWWRLPLKNLKMLCILLSAMLLGNLLPLVSRTAQAFLTFETFWTPALLSLLNLLVSTAVLFYGFLMFYKLAPRHCAHASFAKVWIPALIVAAFLQIGQWLFVIYATNFGRFNAVYGTFGGVVALMLWIYVSGLVIVFGACMCATYGKMPQEVQPASGELAAKKT